MDWSVALTRDYHWYDGTTYYDGTEYYAAAVPENAAETSASVRERLDVAWRTFHSDYFAYRRP